MMEAFCRALSKSKEGMAYLEERNLPASLVEEGIWGLIPPYSNHWFKLLLGRLVTPICDSHGRIKILAGRQLPFMRNSVAQYYREYNSPERAQAYIDKWDNPKASEMIAHYNTNSLSGIEIYINGTMTVDANITFANNCTLWFTQTGKVKLVGPYTFTVDESILQAACDYWLGIEADDPQQKVILQNDSYIKKAGIGLHASNGAVVEVSDSHFEDNYQYGIYINSTAGPYAGIINHNTFTIRANLPTNPFPPIKAGIHLYDVSQLNIGDIGNANTGNHFEGLSTDFKLLRSC